MSQVKFETKYYDTDEDRLERVVLELSGHRVWFDADGDGGELVFAKIEKSHTSRYKLHQQTLEDVLTAIHAAANYLRGEGFTVTVFSDEFKDLLDL